jgi:hypothetical protein
LIVTDPDGFAIDVQTSIITTREVLHEVPDQLYYIEDSNDDDTVLSPKLKAGDYLVKVVPKPGTSPTQTYGLTMQTAGGITTLAENVPIGDIPSEGYGIASTGVVTPFIPVAIHVGPTINLESHGKIRVAILSSATFDVRSIDTRSLTFGRTGSEPSLAFCNDREDDDRVPALVCHFNTQKTGFQLGDTRGILEGRTVDGKRIKGVGSIRIGHEEDDPDE